MYDIIDYTNCTESQQRDIFNLRNLPEIREWMANAEPITWHSHLDFVESLRHTNVRRYYAVFMQGKLVGTYNLTKVSDMTWERGIIISPQFQGTGLAAEIECGILDSLPNDEFKTITAKVKRANLRSIRYHEKVGYMEACTDNKFVYFKLDTDMICKFTMGGVKRTPVDGVTQVALIVFAYLHNGLKVCK